MKKTQNKNKNKNKIRKHKKKNTGTRRMQRKVRGGNPSKSAKSQSKTKNSSNSRDYAFPFLIEDSKRKNKVKHNSNKSLDTEYVTLEDYNSTQDKISEFFRDYSLQYMMFPERIYDLQVNGIHANVAQIIARINHLGWYADPPNQQQIIDHSLILPKPMTKSEFKYLMSLCDNDQITNNDGNDSVLLGFRDGMDDKEIRYDD
jgi:hypothetical protein